jgi:hypothetical protein
MKFLPNPLLHLGCPPTTTGLCGRSRGIGPYSNSHILWCTVKQACSENETIGSLGIKKNSQTIEKRRDDILLYIIYMYVDPLLTFITSVVLILIDLHIAHAIYMIPFATYIPKSSLP